MRIGQLANKLDITTCTVRYYTKIGLLSPVKNRLNGNNYYGANDYRRLRFIVSARKLGFSINDMARILEVAEQGKTTCFSTRQLIELRLAETEEQFLQSFELRARMHSLINDWRGKQKKESTDNMIWTLIDAL